MIHIPQDELLKKIEQEHMQLFGELIQESGSELENDKKLPDQQQQQDEQQHQQSNMSSILPATCAGRRDKNNNVINAEDDEVQAVLITGKTNRIVTSQLRLPVD